MVCTNIENIKVFSLETMKLFKSNFFISCLNISTLKVFKKSLVTGLILLFHIVVIAYPFYANRQSGILQTPIFKYYWNFSIGNGSFKFYVLFWPWYNCYHIQVVVCFEITKFNLRRWRCQINVFKIMSSM